MRQLGKSLPWILPLVFALYLQCRCDGTSSTDFNGKANETCEGKNCSSPSTRKPERQRQPDNETVKPKQDDGGKYEGEEVSLESGSSSASNEEIVFSPMRVRRSLKWIKASNGSVPPNAVRAGYDENYRGIFVGRALHDDQMIPCKVEPFHNCCYVPFNDSEHQHREYEVLTNSQHCHMSWRHVYGGNIPVGAVPGGKLKDGEILYIGLHKHKRSMTLGRVHPGEGCMYLPYHGNEYRYTDYDILLADCTPKLI